MDTLHHLLSTAEGCITNRTYHSDYCFAYAMMKMGYLSKNYYEMRYTVSCAAVDGSGGATDLPPNVSFFLDISPEESFETIKARGNEAEIATCNLDFLKYLDEAYRGFWAEDMHNKGCTVINVDPVSKFRNLEEFRFRIFMSNFEFRFREPKNKPPWGTKKGVLTFSMVYRFFAKLYGRQMFEKKNSYCILLLDSG